MYMNHSQLVPREIMNDLLESLHPLFEESIFEILPIFNPKCGMFNLEETVNANPVKALFMNKLKQNTGVFADKNIQLFLKNPSVPLKFKHRHFQMISWMLTLNSEGNSTRKSDLLKKIYGSHLQSDLSELALAEMVDLSNMVGLYEHEEYFTGVDQIDEQTSLYYQSCTVIAVDFRMFLNYLRIPAQVSRDHPSPSLWMTTQRQ